MNLTKDTYEYILNFADDREIVNMLLVNKKFAQKLNDDNFFRKLMERKYPLLIEFRRENETWKNLYLRMVKYISLLQDEYGIPYLNVANYNPVVFYQFGQNYPHLLDSAIRIILTKGGDSRILSILLDKFINKYSRNPNIDIKNSLNSFIYNVVESKNLENVKVLLEKGADDYTILLIKAVYANNFEIVKFVMENFYKRGLISEKTMLEALYDSYNANIRNYLTNFI